MPPRYDLCLTLTPPPADAPEGIVAALALQCSELGVSHTGLALGDPFTSDERKELEWYLEEYWKWPFEQFAERGARVEASLIAAGKRLYDALCANREATRLMDSWNNAAGAHQITIISEIPAVLSLPWELLHDEHGYLALRTREPVTILRRLPQNAAPAPQPAVILPLRVLLVTARPEDAGFVDPRSIARELLDALQPQIEQGQIALEFLRPATFQKLRERLAQDPPIHILHFDGHGSFGARTEVHDQRIFRHKAQGTLAFEDDEGDCDPIAAERLRQLLQASGVRLAVLNACQSAKFTTNEQTENADDVFSSVAAQLIAGGLDAVIAMSASVLVASATKYVEAFYGKLAAGEAVALAHERARQALHDNPERHRHRRRRDEAGAPIKLNDWWLPHFYQQRPLNFTLQNKECEQPAPPNSVIAETQVAHAPRTAFDLPPAPLYGFTGRARELHKIERWLLHGCAVVVHGFGGTGKTALAVEAADWLTRTGMYDVTCFVSFEHGGDASSLLSALAHRLDAVTGEFDTRNVNAALAQLQPVLRTRRTLVIADNLESILPGGEAPLDAAACAQLWDVLLRLNQMGAGVILTSQNVVFGDGRMAHGKTVKHYALGGLHAEDAYALVEQLCKDLDIPLSRAPYPQVRDLLVQLDHHPLAIQLVLTQLRDVTLTVERLSTDFAALLPRFSDDNATGRSRSLLASLEYSLRRLSEEDREWLTRLAPFEGGAFEPFFLAITEIPESDWRRLRLALERAALLTAEQIKGVSVPFLRFHPILTPYLRTQTIAPEGEERHALRYHAEAAFLSAEDHRAPLAVRSLFDCELPNLRRALHWLLNNGAINEAVELEECIARFLKLFGWWRERDKLRERVEQAFAVATKKIDDALTEAEWSHQIGMVDDELLHSDYDAAYIRSSTLLQRIEATPVGYAIGQESYEHCRLLRRLAHALSGKGVLERAEQTLNQAREMLDTLLASEPENRACRQQLAVLLTELGDVLKEQGKYSEAEMEYDDALGIAEQLGDIRQQAVIRGNLGKLALEQADFDTAHEHFQKALERFQNLAEPSDIALAWLHLGELAAEVEQEEDAENFYRESLKLYDFLGDERSAAMVCTNLGLLAAETGRAVEAEGWYKRALKTQDLPLPKEALLLNNFADLLKEEVLANRMGTERLSEARNYAECALKICETIDTSSEIGAWTMLSILAEIAEFEGDIKSARDFRCRERESFAAFAGNRWHIDQEFSDLIEACAEAARGDAKARADVEAELPQLEADGWHLTAALQRLWAGEHDWHALADELDREEALLMLRVLETLEG